MDFKQVVRLLVRKRWIILAVLLPAVILTEVLTLTQAPVYQATATYVLKLTGEQDPITAIDILSRRPEIATTFAEAAGSRRLREETADELGLSARDRASLTAASRLIAGTNILEISVQGGDPGLVQQYTNALGRRTIDYVKGLYGAFGLEPLDDALLPRTPIRPSPLLNLAIGTFLGLVLGVGLALATGALDPAATPFVRDVLDPETGVRSHGYFLERLRQEIGRVKHGGYPLSVALLDVNHRGLLDQVGDAQRTDVLRRVAGLSASTLREEHIVGRYEDNVFAYLLVDMRENEAREIMERLRAMISTMAVSLDGTGVKVRLTAAVGVAAAEPSGDGRDDLVVRARQALERAAASPDGGVRVFNDDVAGS